MSKRFFTFCIFRHERRNVFADVYIIHNLRFGILKACEDELL